MSSNGLLLEKSARSLKPIAAAETALRNAAARTVRSMSLAAQDMIIAAVQDKLDKPVNFTAMRSAYIAGAPRWDGDYVSSLFRVKAQQSAYLQYVFGDETVRRPGDPGSNKNRIWTPAAPGEQAITDRYGNIRYVKLHEMMLLAMQSRPGKRAVYGTKVPSSAGGSRGYFFGRHIAKSGKVVWGLWRRPKRTLPANEMQKKAAEKRTGTPIDRHRRDELGRFAPSGLATAGTRKRPDMRVRNTSPLKLVARSVQSTQHHRIIDLAALLDAARRKAVDGYGRRLAEEVRKLGG